MIKYKRLCRGSSELAGSRLHAGCKGYELKNELGAGGFIEILARAAIGRLVMIAVKRSDRTARTAWDSSTRRIHKKYLVFATADLAGSGARLLASPCQDAASHLYGVYMGMPYNRMAILTGN